MQKSIENKRLTVLVSLLIVTVIIAVPMIAFGAPQGGPDTNVVSATFNRITLPNGPAMTGSLGRFIGITGTLLNGKEVGNGSGYVGASALCQKAFADPKYSGVHVCTAKEMTNSYENGITNDPEVANTTVEAWINNGAPGYFSSLSNDCNGWQSDNTEYTNFSTYGSKWLFSSKTAGAAVKLAKATSCNSKMKIACCTY
jgi:hypothetical protein